MRSGIRSRSFVCALPLVMMFSPLLVACGDDDGDDMHERDAATESDAMDAADDVAELVSFCAELAQALCWVCGPVNRDCLSELSTDCARNGYVRLPERRYDPALGAACLAEIDSIDCDHPPLSCDGLVAIEECNYFLDGQTTRTCADGGS